MSNKRITDLTELTTPTTDDVFPVVDIATNTTTKVQLANLPVQTAVTTALATKQATLVSGTNIKTVNSTTLLGSGDVAVQETLVSGTNIKTLNSVSLLGAGNIVLTANPSGVSGAIQFSDGSAFASDAANFFWNNTTKRLGVGTNTPTTSLDVNGSIRAGVNLTVVGEIQNPTVGVVNINGELRVASPNVSIGLTSYPARLAVKGSGSTSATTSLLVQNSAGTSALTVKDDLSATFGGSLTIPNFQAISSGTNSITFQTFRTLFAADFNTLAGQYAYNFEGGGGNNTVTSGTLGRFNLVSSFAPTSGTAVYNTALINPTVNQTGGANGITRGLFIQSTLTAAADFRAIEVSNGGAYINTTSVQASAILQADSTTKGFLPPRMTTTQRNAIASPAAGLVVYDSTTNKLQCYNGSTWNDLF
jgi:hypothetical protein